MAPCEARVHTHACWREPCENRAVPHARGARARARTKKSIHAAYKSCHVLSVASRAFACARAGRGRGTPSATGGTQSKGTDKRALCSVQIKSLDKKLRKLDAAMTHAKDDPSMLHAVNGYARWSGTSEHAEWTGGAESPMLCPTDASNAVTPRHSSIASPSCSGSRTPDAPFPSARPRDAATKPPPARTADAVPVHMPAQTHGQAQQGAPITVDISLPPAMLKEMTAGNKNISFVVKGLNGASEQPAVDVKLSDTSRPGPSAGAEAGEEKMGREQDGAAEEASHSGGGMSDEEIIALLADCAARPEPSHHDKFAQVLSERMNAVADEMRHSELSESAENAHALGCARPEHEALEDGDDELMAALANCCGGQSPFEGEDDERGCRQTASLAPGSVHLCTLSEDVEEEMMDLEAFAGCHGMALQDLT